MNSIEKQLRFSLRRILARIEKQVKTINQQAKSNHSNEKPTPPAPRERVSISPIEFGPAAIERYYTEQKKSNRFKNFQVATFWVNLATLIVLAVYTVFTYHISVANNMAANAAKTAAEAAATSNSEAEARFQRDQRAWITMDQIEIDPLEVGKEAEIFVIFRDTGKTPARALRYASVSIRLGSTELRIRNDITGEVVIGPGAGFGGRLKTDHPWLQSEIDRLKAGTLLLIIRGQLSYLDLFSEQPRHTNFCVTSYKESDRILAACKIGNSVD